MPASGFLWMANSGVEVLGQDKLLEHVAELTPINAVAKDNPDVNRTFKWSQFSN
jgi:hypothetical protein